MTTPSMICPHNDDLGVRLDARIVDVLLLVLFAVTFFMAAFVSFLRSDVQ